MVKAASSFYLPQPATDIRVKRRPERLKHCRFESPENGGRAYSRRANVVAKETSSLKLFDDLETE